MVSKSLVLPAPSRSVTSDGHVQGKDGFTWVFCAKWYTKLHGLFPQESLLVKKVFGSFSSSGERFALLPSCVLTLSPKWFKDIYKAVGWSFQGQVWGMDQSKVKWPIQGANLWPWPPNYCILTDSARRAHPSFRPISNTETLPGCLAEHSDQAILPRIMSLSPSTCICWPLVWWFWVRTKHILDDCGVLWAAQGRLHPGSWL